MINYPEMWKTLQDRIKRKRSVKELTYDEINGKELILIDVRSKREFKENHLRNAVNIPLFQLKQKINAFTTYKNQKIVLYCQSGIRSKKAVTLLEGLGYTNVYHLKGGLENIEKNIAF